MSDLRKAAEQEQEPVAVFHRCNNCGHAYEGEPPTQCDCMEGTGFDRVEYFTHSPRREPLTDEQRAYMLMEHLGPLALTGGKMTIFDAFSRAVDATEAAHGITGEKT